MYVVRNLLRMGKMGRNGSAQFIVYGGDGEGAEIKIQNSRAAVGAKHLAVTLQLFLLIMLQMLCPDKSSTGLY